jgi:hypothetical protein
VGGGDGGGPSPAAAFNLGALRGGSNINTFGSSFDTELGLFDANGGFIASNDDSGGLQSQLQIPNALGTYFVAMSGYNTTYDGVTPFNAVASGTSASGTGQLNYIVADSGNGTAATRGPATWAPGQVDWFTFTVDDVFVAEPPANPTALGSIRGQHPVSTFNSDFDTSIAVYGVDGSVIATNNDADGTLQSFIRAPNTAGTYYLAVSSTGASFNGDYDAVAGGGAGNALVNYHPSAGSQTTSGPTAINSSVEWYSFSVDAPFVPSAPAATSLGVARAGSIIDTFGSAFDTEIGLYDASGNLIASNDDTGGPQSQLALPNTIGTYYVSVSGRNSLFANGWLSTSTSQQTGSGVLNFVDGNGNPMMTSNSFAANDVAWYTLSVDSIPTPADLAFDLGTLDAISFIDTNGSTFDTEIGLYDSSGNLIANDDDGGDGTQSLLRLPNQVGTFYLAVSGFNTTYADGFDVVVSPTSAAGDVTLNYVQQGGSPASDFYTSAVGQLQWYVFDIAETVTVPPPSPIVADLGVLGTADDPLSIDTLGSFDVDNFVPLDTELAIYDANGSLVDSNDDGPTDATSLLDYANGLAAGTYYMVLGMGAVTHGTEFFEASVSATAPGFGDYVMNVNGVGVAFGSMFGNELLWFSFSIDPGAALAGDFNGDGIVDAADYTVWRDTQGATGAGLAADANGDNVVNAADYAIWRSNFGQTQASLAAAGAVPEPASLMLAGVLAVALGTLARRAR